MSNPPQRSWDLIHKSGEIVSVDVNCHLESNDSRFLGDAVYAGWGIGVRSEKEIEEAQKSQRLKMVLPDYRFQTIDVLALYTSGRLKIKRVKIVLDAISEALKCIE